MNIAYMQINQVKLLNFLFHEDITFAQSNTDFFCILQINRKYGSLLIEYFPMFV